MEFVCNWCVDRQCIIIDMGIWYFCFEVLSKIGWNKNPYVNEDSFIIFPSNIKDAEWGYKIISAIIFQLVFSSVKEDIRDKYFLIKSIEI